MKYLFIFLLVLQTGYSSSQEITTSLPISKWEASVGSGLYLDLFYANIIFGGDDSTPQSYPDKKGNRVNVGKNDRVEFKYFINPKSAVSIYFQNARYTNLFGSGNDPLGVWKDLKRHNRRMHFTLNYYRMISSGKKSLWSFASGFQVQIEKVSFPFYRTDDPTNPTLITDISGIPSSSYFEDWAIPLTIAHHWTINKNLKLGLMLNTAYTTGTGVDGLALMGNIVIPFGKEVKPKYKK
jgi:hypothetical protein